MNDKERNKLYHEQLQEQTNSFFEYEILIRLDKIIDLLVDLLEKKGD